MPSAANKWIIENPVATPPHPVSEMRHSHLSTAMTQPEIDFVCEGGGYERMTES